MIANIRVIEGGESRALCQLDLMKFSQSQVQQRMAERGFDERGFYVCGFDDWGVDTIISLSHAYEIKEYIETCCQGDDYLVKELLKKHWSVELILEKRFEFVGEKEVELLTGLIEGRTARNIARLLLSAGSVQHLIARLIQIGTIIATAKGFYISSYRKGLNG